MIVLDYMPQKGSAFVSKTLNSAMANAVNNFDLNKEELYVSQIYAGDGPTLKRFKAGARGRFQAAVETHVSPMGDSGRARGSRKWVVKFIPRDFA